ncbi:hypothetical protein [Dactylosporangium sp. NPDC049140]|uniref:hypothetical protein n=1 Tax=Dactylosporangium sp. NPDC049140 TaxID=3155647 RepID=UPI003409F89A
MTPARLGTAARRAAVLIGLALLAACTSSGPAPGPTPTSAGAPAPCRVDLFTGGPSAGLAILWAGPLPGADVEQDARASLPAALTAIDVRTGQTRSYCPLPAPAAGVLRGQDHVLGMQQDGAGYPPFLTDLDLLLRTQFLSPDLRWFAAPGLPLVDVAAGRITPTDWAGTTMGLGRDLALIKNDQGAWCTRSLPPKSGEPCTPLTAPPGAGGFVIGADGRPAWVPAAVRPFAFGSTTAYAITDGTRLYAGDTRTAAARKAAPQALMPADPPLDLTPTGRGGFATLVPGQPQALHSVNDWFTVDSIAGGRIRTAYHHTAAPNADTAWMWGGAVERSRTITDDGRVAVTAAADQSLGTRFGAVAEGDPKAHDLTRERGLHCPRPASFCRILSWPDGTLGNESAPAP